MPHQPAGVVLISDNSLDGLIAKSSDRLGNLAFQCAATLARVLLGKAGFIDIAISNQLPPFNSLEHRTPQPLKHTHRVPGVHPINQALNHVLI